MSEVTLNETPVRTARNFQINNIKLKDINYNVNIGNFENTKINGLGSNVSIDEDVNDEGLKYGVGKNLEKEVREKANCKKRIIIKEKVEEQMEIIHTFDTKNLQLIENLEVVARQDSKADIVLKYDSQLENKFYHNGRIKILAEKNAKVTVTILNFLNTKSINLLSIEGRIEDNAEINMIFTDFGGKTSVVNCYLDVERKLCKRGYSCDLFRKRRATI